MVLMTVSHPTISTMKGNDLTQLHCLSEAIYFEASNQSIHGKEAVALVIKNRVNDKKTNYCKEIRRPYQFSYRNGVAFKQAKLDMTNPHTFQKIQTVVHSAYRVQSGLETDTTKGATSYMNPRAATDFSWVGSMKKTTTIGDHVFYKKV